jgi:gluconolactonase
MWRIDMDKKVEKLFSTYNGKLLNAPNDLWITPTGAIYFTDPFYKRDYWTRGPSEQDVQGVYYVAPDSTTPVRVVDDIVQPNGIIGTPDGKILYVADIGDKKIYRYAIQEDGTLTDRVLFCHQGSDGMTIDTEGNIYLTGKGVLVFNPEGEQIDHIRVPEPWTANVCFGGPDRKALYITSSTALYRQRTRTQGVK